jgi:hypothetical protein
MNNLLKYIGKIINNGYGMPYEYWLIILLSFFIFVFVTTKLAYKQSENSTNLRFYINIINLKLLIILFTITLFIIIFIFIFHYHYFFILEHYDLDFITIIALFSVFNIIFFYSFKSKIDKKFTNYTKLALNIQQKTEFSKQLVNSFNKIKLASFLLIIPFLLLLFQGIVKQKAEVSIIIDNSGSTDTYMHYAREYLSKATKNIIEDTKFYISYFPQNLIGNQQLKENTNDIVKESNYNNLISENLIFKSAKQASFSINNTIINSSQLGTPLTETIWANYLLSISNKKPLSTRILVLMTDGAGNLYNQNTKNTETQSLDIFNVLESKTGKSIYDYYNKIAVINIGKDNNIGLFKNIESDIIYDGHDEKSYEEALNTAVEDIQKRNWWFVSIISFITIITVLLTINVKLKHKF